MTLEIKIDTRNVSRMLKKAPIELQKTNTRMLNLMGVLAQREMISQAPKGVSSPALRETIRYTSNSEQAIIRPEKRYGKKKIDATVVEKGRRPNKGKMPPYKREWGANDFVDWAESKDIAPYVLARSIQKKGTKATNFVAKTFKIVKPKVRKFAEKEISSFISNIKKGRF